MGFVALCGHAIPRHLDPLTDRLADNGHNREALAKPFEAPGNRVQDDRVQAGNAS